MGVTFQASNAPQTAARVSLPLVSHPIRHNPFYFQVIDLNHCLSVYPYLMHSTLNALVLLIWCRQVPVKMVYLSSNPPLVQSVDVTVLDVEGVHRSPPSPVEVLYHRPGTMPVFWLGRLLPTTVPGKISSVQNGYPEVRHCRDVLGIRGYFESWWVGMYGDM